MAMAILPSALSLPKPPPPALSSIRFLTNGEQFMVPTRLSIRTLDFRASNLTIRMGGGPRTFPGGVSKWQWKRMQAKKAKQLLKARLCRERQMYEMRKRTELKSAISELERPWEVVEKAPNLFSVKADEQVKVLADRFQKPGGFDMWSERDGPQILRPYDGLPSARFFPKGVVHSVKPYGVIDNTPESSGLDNSSDEEELQFDDWIARGKGGTRRMRRSSSRRDRLPSGDEGVHETQGLTRSSVSDGSSYAGSSGLGVPRAFDSEKQDETEDRKYLADHTDSKRDFIRGRKAPDSSLRNSNHHGRVNNEANAAKHKKFSGKNGRTDFLRSPMSSSYGGQRKKHDGRYSYENSTGPNVDPMTNGKVERVKIKKNGRTDFLRSPMSSSYGGQRKKHDGRYSYENSTGPNVDPMTNGKVERVKIKSNGRENVTDRFIAGRNLLQDKISQGSNVYRRRMFNWSEDDNFGNSR